MLKKILVELITTLNLSISEEKINSFQIENIGLVTQ